MSNINLDLAILRSLICSFCQEAGQGSSLQTNALFGNEPKIKTSLKHDIDVSEFHCLGYQIITWYLIKECTDSFILTLFQFFQRNWEQCLETYDKFAILVEMFSGLTLCFLYCTSEFVVMSGRDLSLADGSIMPYQHSDYVLYCFAL